MADYSILIAGQIAANTLDNLVKSGKCGAVLENGNIVTLNSLSTTTGESEVYIASTPVTASLSTDVFYMVDEPVNVLVNSIYSGLIDDPRDFNIAANAIFRATKPMVGDEIIVSTDGISGSLNTYAIPANASHELAWSASLSGVSLAYKHIETTTITVGSTKVVAYKLLCVKA
jgi:hypothetical protein